MDNNLAFKDLQLIKQVFEKYEVPFFLAYGTALGAYRDKDFLPDDDDIDLGVVGKIDLQTRKAIGHTLLDLGFETQPIAFNVYGKMEVVEQGYNGDTQTGIIVCQRNIKITIFFFQEMGCEEHEKEMVCIPKLGALKLIASPSKFYKQLEIVKFKKEKFLVPSPIKDYLTFTYGDWKDKLLRNHGLTYEEMHPKFKAIMEDITKNNGVAIFKNVKWQELTKIL